MKSWIAAVFGMLPLMVLAQEQKVGDWTVVDTGEFQIAKVFNAASNTAGVLCSKSTNSCSPYVTFGLKCDGGSKYTVMLNSPVGAVSTTATCMIIEKVSYMFLDDAASTVAAFESGGEVGFVTPAESGKFQVVRFSSAGATAAIRMAREWAAKPQSPSVTSRPASQQL
jgi:hypothetical protein